MKKCLFFVLITIFGLFLISCPDNGIASYNPKGKEQKPEHSYIEVYENPITKYWEYGDIDVSLVARGKYNDFWFQTSYLWWIDDFEQRNKELGIRDIIYEYDQAYEKLTSFLNLYENNSRIQVYNHIRFGGIAFFNGEMALSPGAHVSLYVHELTHILTLDNFIINTDYESWYLEFLAMMGEIYYDPSDFNNYFLGWKNRKATNPFDSWFEEDWDYETFSYYTVYGAFAYFLYDIYGEDIFYDLMNGLTTNQQALSDVLTKRGTTLSIMIAEFENIR